MNSLAAACVYLLCLLASLLCASLLMRAWHRSGSRLLLWTGIGFGFFALNNLALAVDMLALPNISLWALRFIPSFIGVAVLLYGFIWESGR